MSDTDLINLYSGRILELACDIPLSDRLAAPQASSVKRAPLCGSKVTVDLVLQDGKISAFGQDVKACALGQAAASLMARHIIGRTYDEVRDAAQALRDLLDGAGPGPKAPFEGYNVLTPAAAFKNRHASIMLSFDATLDAMAQAERMSCAYSVSSSQ